MANNRSERLSATFGALSDPTRREMLVRLRRMDRPSVSQLAAGLPIGLPTVLKHLNVLAGAGLVRREKRGRIVFVRLAPAPLRDATRWLESYEAFWAGSLDKLARELAREE